MILSFLIFVLAYQTSAVTLREAALHKRFYVGAAAHDQCIGDPQQHQEFLKVLAAQYNLITAENGCKWQATEPGQGRFDFTECDAAHSFAMRSNMTFRGHNLCWGESNPGWLNTLNPAQKKQALATHISVVTSHYVSSKILIAWDVVNEALSDDPNVKFKNNTWYPAIPDYVEYAFLTARKTVPAHVKLYYNDYNIGSATGWSANKSQKAYDMIKSMRAKGVPIDGVGLQLHINVDYSDEMIAGIAQNMQRYQQLGVQVQVTELDVSCNPCNSQQKARQAQIYAKILSTCQDFPGTCTSFESWGFTDKYTWLAATMHPLPFDVNYQPKPAVQAMLDALGA